APLGAGHHPAHQAHRLHARGVPARPPRVRPAHLALLRAPVDPHALHTALPCRPPRRRLAPRPRPRRSPSRMGLGGLHDIGGPPWHCPAKLATAASRAGSSWRQPDRLTHPPPSTPLGEG